MKTSPNTVQQCRSLFAISSILLSTVLGLSAILSSSTVSADSVVDKINITVPISCTLEGTGQNSHNATINNGQYNSAIGETTMKAFCNDNEGFAIYAIGYTDNINGKNVLTNSTLGSIHDIVTGTATSGDNSNWAMKLSTISSPTPTYPITIQNSYDSFHSVPVNYELVASRSSGTDIGQAAEGTTLKTTYQAYISQTQAAGTYAGQVKYTLLHPSVNAPNNLYMQNVDEWGDKLAIGQEVYAIDERDGQGYSVARLADGSIWMTQNLRLSLETANITADNTNNPSEAFLSVANVQPAPAPNNETWCYNTDEECINRVQYSTINIGDETIDEDGNPRNEYGVYYNWYTATAGNGADAKTLNQDAVGDICPRGWRLPEARKTINGDNNDFWAMSRAIVGFNPADGAAWIGDSEATDASTAMLASPNNFLYSGAYVLSGVTLRTKGLYWSSTMGYSGAPFVLSISSNRVQPIASAIDSAVGATIRCVAKKKSAQEAVLDVGEFVNGKIKSVASGEHKLAGDQTNDIKTVRMANALPASFEANNTNTISSVDSKYPIYIFYDNTNNDGILYVYTKGDRIAMNPESSRLFMGNLSLIDVSTIKDWDASSVVKMNSMFTECESLTSVDLSDWDVSSVLEMSGMFSVAKSLESLNVTGWNTSNVTTMHRMFGVGDDYTGNGQLREIIGIENWDVSNVTNMTTMFYGAGQMTHYDIANWDVSKVESFNHMFTDNFKLESLDLSKWNVSSVKTMYNMFDDDRALTTIGDVSHWNTASLIDVGGWLNGATSFVGDNGTLDLSGWNTSNLKTAGEMFRATKLETIDLSGWSFNSITNDTWEGTGTGIYYTTGNQEANYKALGGMFLNVPTLTNVYVSQSGLNSFNTAVNNGVNTTNMWSGSGASGFTVKP